MKVSDLDKLKKFMTLTLSENDPEALTAVRMANKLMAANRVTWEELITKQVKYELDFGEDAAEVHSQDENITEATRRVDEINGYFEKALAMVRPGDFRNFILKLQHEWTTQGWLPDKAIATVKNAGIPWALRQKR